MLVSRLPIKGVTFLFHPRVLYLTRTVLHIDHTYNSTPTIHLHSVANNPSQPEPGAVMRPPPIEPAAPYTGTLRYPIDDLLSLARLIVDSVERHHRGLFEAAEAAGDDDEAAEQADYLMDVDSVLCAIDRPRWKARVEKDDPDRVWTEADLLFMNEPRYAEFGLFAFGHMKSEWVIGEGIAMRKDARGLGPSSDTSWSKEDALLDFLLFLTKYNHAGLFEPM